MSAMMACYSSATCLNVIGPMIGLSLCGVLFIIVSGLLNTGILMSLAHTINSHHGNISSLNLTIVCDDPSNVLCEMSSKLVSFYYDSGEFSFTFFFGWAIALVVIEMVKLVIIVSLAYGVYCIYLRQRYSDLVALFPKVASLQGEPTEYDEEEIDIHMENELSSSSSSAQQQQQQQPRRRSSINFDDTTDESL